MRSFSLCLTVLAACSSAEVACPPEGAVLVPGPQPGDQIDVAVCYGAEGCEPVPNWRVTDAGLSLTCQPGSSVVVWW